MTEKAQPTAIATMFAPFSEHATETSAPLLPRVHVQMPPASAGPRYETKSILGRGGMGEVRLCHDSRIGRDVAIKVALMSNESGRVRFLREAHVQAQLEHPAIVPVHDLEVLDDGTAYFAMKRVRGATLAEILDDLRRGTGETASRFPLRRLLAVYSSVCMAVDFAHTHGVVHRDIKPSNVMVGDFGEVYLLDWGIAKINSEGDVASSAFDENTATQTNAGSILGTPGYMAPEQIDPSIASVGPRSDVYALGAVLFEILAREPYIRAKDTLEATLLTLNGTDAEVAKRAANVAPALNAVCRKALARNPADRYASARELHDAVDAHLAGEENLARRREMSSSQLQEAERALAAGDSDDARVEALRALGASLSLDPQNADARRSLLHLLTTPPRRTPAEVRRRIDADVAEQTRMLAKLTAFSTVGFYLAGALAFAIGVKEPRLFIASLALVLLSALINLGVSRSQRPSAAWQYASLAALLLSHVAFARVAGPHAIVPALVIAYACARQSHPDALQRRVCVALCCAYLGLIFVLDFFSAESAYALVEGGVLVRERLLRFNAGTLFFLLVVSLGAILTPTLVLARTRAQLAIAETKLHMQSWQLEQLVRTTDSAPSKPSVSARVDA